MFQNWVQDLYEIFMAKFCIAVSFLQINIQTTLKINSFLLRDIIVGYL